MALSKKTNKNRKKIMKNNRLSLLFISFALMTQLSLAASSFPISMTNWSALVDFSFVTDAPDSSTSTSSVPVLNSSSLPAKPLMAGLNTIGLSEALSTVNINFYGFVEAGYFYDATSPKNGSGPTFVGFNSFKNQGVLNKIDLSFERTVDPTKKQFDIGFRLEGIWGADAAFIHSNGMGDKQTSRNQFDLLQPYLDIAMPGIPLRIRVGKWIELAGFEQYSANIYGAFSDPSKALYSYSYQFLYAEPGTQTGILATYFLNNQLSFDAGFTRGWNQSIKTSHTYPDFLGRVTFIPSDKTAITFVMTEGPEFPASVGTSLPEGDNSDWWTALDLVVTQKISDSQNIGLGVDFVNSRLIPGFQGAQRWGGLAGYFNDVIDPNLIFNSRVEWFDDPSGFSTGALVGANYYEATLGVAIKPALRDAFFSNLLFCPEIRYDYSDHALFGSGKNGQTSFSIETLFAF